MGGSRDCQCSFGQLPKKHCVCELMLLNVLFGLLIFFWGFLCLFQSHLISSWIFFLFSFCFLRKDLINNRLQWSYNLSWDLSPKEAIRLPELPVRLPKEAGGFLTRP